MAGGGEEKTEKATPKKRRDARKEGQVLQSKDIASVVFVLGAFCSMRLLFPGIVENASSFMVGSIDALSYSTDVSLGNLKLLTYDFAFTLVSCILPLLLICMALGILGTAVQTKFLFTTKVLKPKLSNLSPIKGIKKMFSLKNLVELIKGILKVIIMAVVLYFVLKQDLETMIKALDVDVRISIGYVLELIFEMIIKLCAIFVAIAFFDWLYQRYEYEKSLRMSKHDIKEEHKQAEGDPKIKGKIKDIQRQRARARMMQAVPEADVIIKNPTHFAVALRYKPDYDNAPIVLAKGQDEVAKRILEVGETHQVSIVENKSLARALYASTEINQEIPADYYGAVAEVLVYVYRLNKKDGVAS